MLNLIDEADILLYEHKNFPHWGWFVAKYSGTPYNHVGLAHWIEGELYIIQFHLFGPRISPISRELKKYAGKIHVYKPVRKIVIPVIENNLLTYKTLSFTQETRKNIINEALGLLHHKYSLKIIYNFFRSYTPFLRLWVNKNLKNGLSNDFVCSTLISVLVRKHFLDPCPYLSDVYTQPGDIARSPLFHYQFTIKDLT
jgi:hypothetical protein